MYRISVTVLEKFRRYMNELSPFDTEEALIETITGVFKGNDKTNVGEAYHKIIEGDFSYIKQSNLYLSGKIAFTEAQAMHAINYKKAHPAMVHEVPVSKIYETSKCLVKISGRTDGIEGMHVRDAKTKFRSVKFQEYYDSFQWRFYLQMLGANVFYYDLFEVQGFKFLYGKIPFFLNDVTIVPHEPFQCIRYENMEQDCSQLLNDFMDYIHTKNFYQLLKKESNVAAQATKNRAPYSHGGNADRDELLIKRY